MVLGNEKTTAKGPAATGAGILTLACAGTAPVPKAGRMQGGMMPVDKETPVTIPHAIGTVATTAAIGSIFVVIHLDSTRD